MTAVNSKAARVERRFIKDFMARTLEYFENDANERDYIRWHVDTYGSLPEEYIKEGE
jgi:hypothetical protein